MSLFPTFDLPDVTEVEQVSPAQYRPCPMFNFESGDFVRDGAGRIVMASGFDAWVIWCTKTILTQRFSHLSYTSNSGIEAVEAFRKSNRAAAQSNFERTITEALLADPMKRTQAVTGFQFVWLPDTLLISLTVVGSDGNTAEIQTKLDR